MFIRHRIAVLLEVLLSDVELDPYAALVLVRGSRDSGLLDTLGIGFGDWPG
jgi:hypothetical protein